MISRFTCSRKLHKTSDGYYSVIVSHNTHFPLAAEIHGSRLTLCQIRVITRRILTRYLITRHIITRYNCKYIYIYIFDDSKMLMCGSCLCHQGRVCRERERIGSKSTTETASTVGREPHVHGISVEGDEPACPWGQLLRVCDLVSDDPVASRPHKRVEVILLVFLCDKNIRQSVNCTQKLILDHPLIVSALLERQSLVELHTNFY